jgi:hypothetical protein
MKTKKEKVRLERALKAYTNERFLAGSAARPLRILSEFLYPLSVIKEKKIRDTIVFFGSARTKSRKEAELSLKLLKTKIKKGKPIDKDIEPAIAKAETELAMSKYYEDAVELSRMLTVWLKSVDNAGRFVICSGGGPGIMEAANKGAVLAGGRSMGFNISLPFEQYPNQYISEDLNFEFHYFFMRKFWFAYLAKAFVMFPGGFGTMDEMMEILTLRQTQKITKKLFLVLYGRDYWRRIINFDEMAQRGMINKEDLELFSFADTPEEAFDILKTGIQENYLAKYELYDSP